MRSPLSLSPDSRLFGLVVVSFAGMCWSLERLAPGSVLFTAPLCIVALVVLAEKE